MCWFNVLFAIWAVSTSAPFISMEEHAYAQLLKWKLSDCRLWHWQLKWKWLTTCIRAPPKWTPALRLLDQRCEILLPIDAPCIRRLSRSISESHHLPALFVTHVPKCCSYLGGCSSGLTQGMTSLLTLGRDGHGPAGPLFCSCSSHFLTVFLCLLYYLLTIPHSSLCNSVL